jgi:hypothetical protein
VAPPDDGVETAAAPEVEQPRCRPVFGGSRPAWILFELGSAPAGRPGPLDGHHSSTSRLGGPGGNPPLVAWCKRFRVTREVWCVEVDQTLIVEEGEDPIRTVLIVVRQDPRSEWQAAMLMTLSAWWPYEACGVTP